MNRQARPGPAALLHGAAWRAASLTSRVAFLLLVVPRTDAGEFGVFFSYSSLALLMSRVVSFGAIDGLPITIRGEAAAMTRASRDLVPMFGLSTAALAMSLATGGIGAATVAVAFSMASALMLAGAVRSARPAWFERWSNLHPVFFLGLALALGSGADAVTLLNCQAAAIVLSQGILLVAATRGPLSKSDQDPGWLQRVQGLFTGGTSRMVSDVLIAACIRAIAVGPLLLAGQPLGDSLALALALGEAAWTVGMILVHRNFSYYCSHAPDIKQSLGSAVVLLVSIGLGGVVAAAAVGMLDWIPIVQRLEPLGLAGALGFFGAITALSELRYYDLARGASLRGWVIGQLGFLVLAASAPIVAGELAAVWTVFVVAVGATATLILARGLRLRAGSVTG